MFRYWNDGTPEAWPKPQRELRWRGKDRTTPLGFARPHRYFDRLMATRSMAVLLMCAATERRRVVHRNRIGFAPTVARRTDPAAPCHTLTCLG